MVTSWSGKEGYKEKKFGDGGKHGALRKNLCCSVTDVCGG